jgi:hypothetical protein
MSKVTGVAEVVLNPNKWGNISILVNEEWYSCKPEQARFAIPNKGDSVEFDNGGKKYINNLVITSGSTGTAPTGSYKGTASKAKPYSSLGVELGHASNVAKDMANSFFAGEDVGSADWYKYWMEHTQKVYKLMSALRDRYENPEETAPAVEEDSVEVMHSKKPSVAETSLEDIFD